MITAGDLNRRITLLQSVTVKVDGVPEEQLLEKQTVSAKFKPITSNEQFKDDRELTGLDAEFIIRRSSEVLWLKAKDALRFDGKVYELIAAPMELGYKEFFALKTKLRDAN